MKNEIDNIKVQIRRKEKKQKVDSNYKWIVRITLTGFLISLVFSSLSEITIPKVNIFIGILILLLVITIGVVFDMIGVAVTASDNKSLNSMSSRKVPGSKEAVYLHKNMDKVSSFCNDVAGDICGIISGATGATIAVNIAHKFNFDIFLTSLFATSIISALTIGGKAICKSYAVNKSNLILFRFAKIISIFKKV